MSVLDLLAKWGFSGGSALVEALQWMVDNIPDSREEAQKALNQLNEVLSPQALALLGATVLTELKDIGSGKLDGRKHPSDLGG